MENCLANARLLSLALEKTGWYVCVSDIHRKRGEHEYKGAAEIEYGEEGETSAEYNAGLPVVAFHFSDEFKKDYSHVKQESVSTLLRAKQYIIPSTSLPIPLSFASLPSKGPTNIDTRRLPSPPYRKPNRDPPRRRSRKHVH